MIKTDQTYLYCSVYTDGRVLPGKMFVIPAGWLINTGDLLWLSTYRSPMWSTRTLGHAEGRREARRRHRER